MPGGLKRRISRAEGQRRTGTDRTLTAIAQPMRSLDADRLTLVPQTAAHADEMFVVLGDPEIYRHENAPPPSVEWLRERFARLETRTSPDRKEQWLNWVLRVPGGALIGYVQATLYGNAHAAIAYELSSAYWGRGLASLAVATMIAELAGPYRVRQLGAVLKRENRRSLRLLERLGFSRASAALHAERQVEPSEMLMTRRVQSV